MRFSVVIPVYNVAAELPRAISSLQAQTCHDFEIVLVDDGSTDESVQVVDSYKNIAKVIHQEHSGVVVARQRGFETSKGDWILFLDGDDAIKPETLSRISAEIDRTNCDIIQFGYEEIQNEIRQSNPPPLAGTFAVDTLIGRMKKTPLEFVGMCIWNKCYRREIVRAVFEDVGDVHISHSEDGLFAFAAFLHSGSISFLEDCFYEYFFRKCSALRRVNIKIVNEKMKFIERIEQLAISSGRLTNGQVATCLDFHCYRAAYYIFWMLRRNRATVSDCLSVLRDLNQSRFWGRESREWYSFKRKMMRFLLAHPRLYCLLGPIVDRAYIRAE